MRRTRAICLSASLLGLAMPSCYEGGASGGGDGDGDGDSPEDGHNCEGEAVAVVAPLNRLATRDYERSLRELFGASVVDGVADRLALLPTDDPEAAEAFGREDHRLSDRHIEAWFGVADSIATAVAADPDLRATVLGPCAESGADEACLRDTLPTFFRRALRRPATAEEIDAAVARALEFSGDEVVHAVVFLALMAPDFLYHFENRGTVEGDEIRLTAHEVAARLSFHFWGAPPDAELLAAAEDGSLDTDEGYRAQVERLFGDARSQATQEEFFGEWLHLGGGGFASSPRLEVLRDGLDLDGLPEAMAQEVQDMLRYHVDGDGLTWQDALTSTQSFAQDDRLAGLYGVPAWDGAGPPPELPAGERSGLLGRAALLYTADGSTNPFRRGAFVRRALLCDTVLPPPADLPPDALEPPEAESGVSTREAFAAKVADQPCAGCHAQFSDLGYALESYDGLGRFRTEERLITTQGEDRGTAPVDPVVVPRIEISDEEPTESVVELNERIAASDKANACLARTYFRFTHRRPAETADNCTIDAVERRLDDGQSLGDALRDVALDPAFRRRRLQE